MDGARGWALGRFWDWHRKNLKVMTLPSTWHACSASRWFMPPCREFPRGHAVDARSPIRLVLPGETQTPTSGAILTRMTREDGEGVASAEITLGSES